MSNSCAPLTYEQLLNYLDQYVNNALLCGKLQGGLLACGSGDCGPILPKDTAVVTCDQLEDVINGLLSEGKLDIPGITSMELVGTDLVLVDQAGKTYNVPLDALAAKGVTQFRMLADDIIALTLADGTELTVDLAYLKDRTVKSFTLSQEGMLTLTLEDSTEYAYDISKLITDAVRAANIVLTDGMLDAESVLQLTLSNGTKISVDLAALLKTTVARDSPLIGDGTPENPLDVDFSRVCWDVIESAKFTSNGLEIKLANLCDPIIVPISEFTTELAEKVKVCVTNSGLITGDGTAGSCLDLDVEKLKSVLLNDIDFINRLSLQLDRKVAVATQPSIEGDGTAEAPLGVHLSQESGNLLSMRDDGLYYGTIASASVAHLYVDPATGNDANDGSLAAPLKTLAHAFALVPSNQSNTIHLRAGQSFTLPSAVVEGGAVRTLQPYGDPVWDGNQVPAISPSQPAYFPEVMVALQRPTVRPEVIYEPVRDTYYITQLNARNGGQLIMLGMHIDTKPLNDVDTANKNPAWTPSWRRGNSAMIAGNATGSIQLGGCIFSLPGKPSVVTQENITYWWMVADSLADGGFPAWALNRCQWPVTAGESTAWGLAAVASCNLYVTAWPPNFASDGVSLVENMSTRLIQPAVLLGIVRDTNGIPRNILTNLVL